MDRNQIQLHEKESAYSNPNWGKQHLWKWKNFHCHWRVLGRERNQPLILLHGFGASSSHWRKNAHYFASNGFTVYGLDLIGFGKSEQPSPKKIKKLDNYFWSMQVAAFLEEIVNTKENGKAVLLGNSLGGLTALTTAAFFPKLIEAVIAAPLPDPAFNKATYSTSSKWLYELKNNFISIFFKLVPLEIILPLIIRTKLINIALQSAYYKSVEKDFDLRNIVIQPTQRSTAPRALRAMCIGMATRSEKFTAPLLLTQINSLETKLPILLIWGDQDKFIPLIIGKKLINQYDWLELLVIEKSGHCPHDESPNKFNQYVLHWLKGN